MISLEARKSTYIQCYLERRLENVNQDSDSPLAMALVVALAVGLFAITGALEGNTASASQSQESNTTGVGLNDISAAPKAVKVLIRHFPPGNPDNVQVICVSPQSAAGHMNHGDELVAPPTASAKSGSGVWPMTN